MGEGYNASRFAYTYADELAFLIVSLTGTINLKAIHSIGQWWDDNRGQCLGRLWFRLILPLRVELCRFRGCVFAD